MSTDDLVRRATMLEKGSRVVVLHVPNPSGQADREHPPISGPGVVDLLHDDISKRVEHGVGVLMVTEFLPEPLRTRITNGESIGLARVQGRVGQFVHVSALSIVPPGAVLHYDGLDWTD